jgi:hypothetical protein
MTILTLDPQGLRDLANGIEGLPIAESHGDLLPITDRQRLAGEMRDCAEHYRLTRVHIELEPNEETLTDDERKLEVVEGVLYRLKERDFATPRDVRAIDDMLAASPAVKVDLYELIRFHEGPEQPSDLERVLELAERFLSEGAELQEFQRNAVLAAIARLRESTPE